MDLQTLVFNPPPVDITVGAWYELHLEERTVRMRAVRKCREFVIFESASGWRECFGWWVLRRAIW